MIDKRTDMRYRGMDKCAIVFSEDVPVGADYAFAFIGRDKTNPFLYTGFHGKGNKKYT
jgi:hypothetical protein